jgi:mRNA (2'-O-methyladenosine-N6-)-methyltransferase
MSDDELRLVLVTALKHLLTSTPIGVSTPLTSLDLLARVLTVPIPSGLLPHSPPPKFRLTDLDRFERLLQELSTTWEEGWIGLSTTSRIDTGNMVVYEIGLGRRPNRTSITHSISTSSTETASTLRKRKRVVDEDADSAADDAEDEDDPLASGQGDVGSLDGPSGGSTLENLSPEMREVYTFMQKGTAKGRLLAERVSPDFDPQKRLEIIFL